MVKSMGLDGLTNYQRWYRRHLNEARATNRETMRKRYAVLSLDERKAISANRRAYKLAYKAIHGEEQTAYYRDYYQKHKAEMIQASYEARDRRRAAKRGVASEGISRASLWERDKGVCGICSGLVAKEKASIDHIVPISIGGPHLWDNVQLAHWDCNRRRGAARIPAQMRLGADFHVFARRPPANAKLNEATVKYIRANPQISYRKLELETGFHWRTIADVRQGRTWKYVI